MAFNGKFSDVHVILALSSVNLYVFHQEILDVRFMSENVVTTYPVIIGVHRKYGSFEIG